MLRVKWRGERRGLQVTDFGNHISEERGCSGSCVRTARQSQGSAVGGGESMELWHIGGLSCKMVSTPLPSKRNNGGAQARACWARSGEG